MAWHWPDSGLLARFLKDGELSARIILAFFDTEEPPYFGGSAMGAHHYAQALRKNRRVPRLMVNLDMVGVYTDLGSLPGTPFDSGLADGMPERFFGPKDFLLMLFHGGSFEEVIFIGNMVRACSLPIFTRLADRGTSPALYSDCRTFMDFDDTGIILVTDTGPFRNSHYHGPGDTPDTVAIEHVVDIAESMSVILQIL